MSEKLRDRIEEWLGDLDILHGPNNRGSRLLRDLRPYADAFANSGIDNPPPELVRELVEALEGLMFAVAPDMHEVARPSLEPYFVKPFEKASAALAKIGRKP